MNAAAGIQQTPAVFVIPDVEKQELRVFGGK